MRAYCLSFHASYRCAHSGHCCTAGWPIPVEPDRIAAMRAVGLVKARDGSDRLAAGPAGLPRSILAQASDGSCVFFEKEGERRCAVHRQGGPSLLPSACRNFPRVALRDPRGIFITLSHFCPTAAALLLNATRIAVVEAPASLSLDGTVEGLDATTVLPPLLAPGMLMDYEGYTAWEHQALAVLDDRLYTPSLAIRVIAAATGDAVQWRPGRGSLAAHVARSFDQSRSRHDSETSTALGRTGHAVKAFLAAHLFASWAACQDGGLSAVVRSIEHAWALIANENLDGAAFIAAVGAADLRIRHASHPSGDHVSTRPLPALRHD